MNNKSFICKFIINFYINLINELKYLLEILTAMYNINNKKVNVNITIL